MTGTTAPEGSVRGGAVAAAVRDFANEVGDAGPVAVVGGKTRWSHGGEVRPGTRLVRAPSGILEYQPEEMTVRVRAGTAVAELREILAASGQRTALPERGGTVGGALSVNENDLCVLARGRVRHAVLQLRYVSAAGSLVTAGAPTVKNVSGFDLPRLLVGSLGTLGLVAEAVLRTRPIPEVSGWLVADEVDPFAVLDAVYAPSACLWDGMRTWLHLEGHRPDVEGGTAAVSRLGSWEMAEGPPALPSHRWSLRPSEIRHLDRDVTGDFVACVGVGTVFASLPQHRSPLPPGVLEIGRRAKAAFDPDDRLNPGRDPMEASQWT